MCRIAVGCVMVLLLASTPARSQGTRPTSSTSPSPEKPQNESDLSPDKLFRTCSPAVVRIVTGDRDGELIAQGSGFFVSADGFVVTNYHVVDSNGTILVKLPNNAVFRATRTEAVSREKDLAILKVDGKGLPFLELSQGEPPPVGTKVYALGNPKGLTNSISEGLISGVRDDDPRFPALQTSAAISPGSSGGPLLTSNGKVIGVTTGSLASGQSLNFAVPSRDAHALLQQALNQKDKAATVSPGPGKRPPDPKPKPDIANPPRLEATKVGGYQISAPVDWPVEAKNDKANFSNLYRSPDKMTVMLVRVKPRGAAPLDVQPKYAQNIIQMLRQDFVKNKTEVIDPPAVVPDPRFYLRVRERIRIRGEKMADQTHLYVMPGKDMVELTVITTSVNPEQIAATQRLAEEMLLSLKPIR